MKTIISILLITVCSFNVIAQNDTTVPKLAIFLPIKLANYFDAKEKAIGDITKEAKTSIDYYYGIKLAAQKLGKNGIAININVYEINNATNLDSLYETPGFNGTHLIMAPVKDDLKALANFANKKEIPFISTLYPYDASTVNNGQLYIANPTLRVHIEEMYNFMASKIKNKKWGEPNVILIDTKNNKDAILHKYFESCKNNQLDLKVTTKNITLSSFNEVDIKIMANLDSTKRNIIYALTLNDTVNNAILKLASKNTKYSILVLGLPYWENFDFLKTDAYKNANYVYSTAYNKFESDSIINTPILKAYQKKYPKMTPNFAFYKSFLFTYKYANLLAKYKSNFIAHINEFDALENNKLIFAPFFATGDNLSTNYHENRKLYFITNQGAKFKAID